jgi:hypothetical protein
MVDPSGCVSCVWTPKDEVWWTCSVYDGNDLLVVKDFCDVDAWIEWAQKNDDIFSDAYIAGEVGWELSGHDEWLFWKLQAIMHLDSSLRSTIRSIEGYMKRGSNAKINYNITGTASNEYNVISNTVYWNPNLNNIYAGQNVKYEEWHSFPPLAGLAH